MDVASISAQPGGIPVRDTRSAHVPEPKEHPGLFVVGDYLFDSTINGVMDSADFATDFFQSWRLKQDLLESAASLPRGLNRSYFDRYHYDLSYEDSYDWYFDPKYIRDIIKIAWKAKPPYTLLDAGSANGLTLADFASCGIKAWGVENNKYIHSRTPAKWLKRNLLGDIRRLPFPDGYFDFVYDTCLAHIPEAQLGVAIGELHRVSRRGVIFASLASDMNPELFKRRDLLMGIKALMPLWEWGELFTAHGFQPPPPMNPSWTGCGAAKRNITKATMRGIPTGIAFVIASTPKLPVKPRRTDEAMTQATESAGPDDARIEDGGEDEHQDAAHGLGALRPVIAFLRPYYRKRGSVLGLLGLGVLAETSYNVAFPLSLKYLIDDALLKQDHHALVWILIVLGVLAVVVTTVAIGVEYLNARLAADILRDIRHSLSTTCKLYRLIFYSCTTPVT